MSHAPLDLREVPPPRGVFLDGHRVLTQTSRGVRLILDTRDIIMTPIVLLHGEWEPETSRALLDILRPGMNFVDVGANMGYFTSLAGLALRGGGQVWAFEPDPVSHEFLADNVALNWLFENIRLERKGVYSRSTTLTLFKREKYVGNTSLGQADADDLARIMDRQTPHGVEVVSLDDYFLPLGQRIDLMKIDVEGAEPHVIQGMAGLLRAARYAPDDRMVARPDPPHDEARSYADDVGSAGTRLPRAVHRGAAGACRARGFRSHSARDAAARPRRVTRSRGCAAPRGVTRRSQLLTLSIRGHGASALRRQDWGPPPHEPGMG